MWLANQLATPSAHGVAPVSLYTTLKASKQRKHAGASIDAIQSEDSTDWVDEQQRANNKSDVNSAHRHAVLETIAPCWRTVQKQIVELDVRDALKWCVGIWERTDTDVE